MDAMRDTTPGAEKSGKSWFGFLRKTPQAPVTKKQQETADSQRRKDAARMYAIQRKLQLAAQEAARNKR